jgi:transcriptional regulator with XRE-family HTH domain
MNETRITSLRRERGWTQEKLAAESGVAVRTVQRLEGGQDASLETLSMVAKALGVSVGELFTAVADEDFNAAVDALDDRTATQQRQRDAAVTGYRQLYTGVGIAITLVIIALIALQIVPGITILVTAAYWAAGSLLARSLLNSMINPRLDARYPLSSPTPRRQSRSR